MSVWMAPALWLLSAAGALVALLAKLSAELLEVLPGGRRGAAAAAGYEAAALWALLAALLLAFVAAATTRRRWDRWAYPVAWEPLGFSRVEARRWARWRFRPEEAVEQRGQGRTPPEAAVAYRLLEGSPAASFLAAASEVTAARAGEEARS